MADEIKYAFIVEWYNDESGLITKYKLLFFPSDNSVEMESDLFIGSSINILARHLCIVDFGDEFTAKVMAGNSERCVCIISPSGTCKAGTYVSDLEKNGFKVINIKMLYLSSMEVRKYFANEVECEFLDKLTSALADHGMIALELMRRDANAILRQIVYGKASGDQIDLFANPDIFVLAHDAEAAAKQAHLLFSTPSSQSSRLIGNILDCTCAVVKPHALNDGHLGEIWASIQEKGFCVVAAQVFRLSKVDAAEFLEVYKGVIAEYPEVVEEFTSGPCVAMQIANSYNAETFDPNRGPDDPQSVQHRFREFVGPMDPEIARYLKPETIRARFGINLIKNALHCTDLPDDVPIEIDFFFRILEK
ncbi:Nucleoside diphosphate kinase 7 [Sparganum proliferum]